MIRTKSFWLATGASAAVVVGLVCAGSQFGLNKLAECCADSITGSEATDECCSESTANGASDSPPVDADREIIFAVEGLMCPAVAGIGCGHRLGPVLQRMDSIEGVEAASANHTGNMVRVTVKSLAKREDVAAVIEKDLATDNYQPQRIIGGDFQNALNQETWRGKERIRELSAIEFRILVLRRISAFAKSEKLTEDVTAELRELAERKWDLLAANAEVTESGKLPDETDWRQRLREFASAFFAEAKPLLTEDQFDRLKSLADGIDGESTAEHE